MFGGGRNDGDESFGEDGDSWDGPVPEPTYEEGGGGEGGESVDGDDDDAEARGSEKEEKSDDDFVEFDASLDEKKILLDTRARIASWTSGRCGRMLSETSTTMARHSLACTGARGVVGEVGCGAPTLQTIAPP